MLIFLLIIKKLFFIIYALYQISRTANKKVIALDTIKQQRELEKKKLSQIKNTICKIDDSSMQNTFHKFDTAANTIYHRRVYCLFLSKCKY